MAEEFGDVGEQRLEVLLDRCLAALRHGDSLTGCLTEIDVGAAAQLRPLLEMALALAGDAVAPPDANLAAGRERLRAALALASNGRESAVASGPLTAALDTAVAAVVAGMPPEEAAARAGAAAGALAPLLHVAAQVHVDAVAPPAPALAGGRTAMLRAAAAAREALAPDDMAAAAALDAALSGHSPDGHGEIHGLLAAAAAVTADALAVPAPPQGLAEGRARLRRALHAPAAPTPAPVGQAADGSGWRGVLGRRWRMAATAAALAAALLVGNNAVLQPAAASALPGSSLYSVKRLSERVSLATALSPAERTRLRGEHSLRRAQELAALSALNDESHAVEWDAKFLGAKELDEKSSDRGLLYVSTLAAETAEPITATLAWNDESKLELRDQAKSLLDLPVASELRLWVRSRGDDRLPLLLRLRLLALASPAPTPTTLPSTATPEPITPTVALASPTHTATAAPPTKTATLEPLPTPAPLDTATSAPVVTTPQASLDLIDGLLLSNPKEAQWTVLADHGEVTVNAARILEKEAPSDLTQGDYVSFDGHWDDGARTRFTARRLRTYSRPDCRPAEAIGVVTAYAPGQSLVLDNGITYTVVGDTEPAIVNGPVAPGSRVRVTYGDCGGRRYVLRAIEVLTSAEIVRFQGVISEVGPTGPNGEAELVITATAGIGRDPVTVRFRPGTTPVTGELAPGAVVRVEGTLNPDNTVAATKIDVIAPAPPLAASPQPSVAPPTATPGAAPLDPPTAGSVERAVAP